MLFKKSNIFIIPILLILQSASWADGKECVLRKSGACKVLNITDVIIPLSIHDFGEIVPDGFQVKTTMEINFFENKYSFTNHLPDERRIPITYSYDYPAPVKVVINGEDKSSSLKIKLELGYVKRRLATLVYKDGCKKLIKHNHYTPILPAFPFILHFEITTNGSFYVYADGYTEPFFHIEELKTIIDKTKCTSNETVTAYKNFIPKNFEIYSYIYNNLIGFYDCSQKNKPNCGTHYVDRLYDCRQEWKGGRSSHGFRSLKKFQETYNNDVLFDEYIVADTEYLRIHFYDDENPKKYFYIGFKVSQIEIALHNKQNTTKIVQTEKWAEQPSRPYIIHVLITTGTDNNYVQISNIRGDSILKLNLCGKYTRLTKMEVSRFAGAIYMDCLIHPPDNGNRRTKFDPHDKDEISIGLTHHDIGLNFTKSYLDIRNYMDENKPFSIYQYDFGVSLDDWCEGDDHIPKLYVRTKKIDEFVSNTDLSEHTSNTSNIFNVSAVYAFKDLVKYLTQN